MVNRKGTDVEEHTYYDVYQLQLLSSAVNKVNNGTAS